MAEEQARIIGMFDDIAHSYDFANHALSFGVDKMWRKEACALALKHAPNAPLNIVDLACGTGDMMLQWMDSNKNIQSIIGIDPSGNMLDLARKKLESKRRELKCESHELKCESRELKCESQSESAINFIQSEAKDLRALGDNSSDIVSIAYGLRNVVELDLALKECARVLKNGGIFVILEFTKKERQGIFDKLALFYTTRILPLLGGLISKNYAAYKYLPNSIEGFVTLENLESMLRAHGFETIIKKRYFANLCSLIIVRKM